MMVRISLAGLIMLLAAPAAGRTPRALRIQRAGDGGMVGMADGTILAWNVQAELQLRSPAGEWRSVWHLPASFVVGAAGAGDIAYVLANAVAAGSGSVVSHVFSVRSDGTVTEVRHLPDGVTSIASSAAHTWIAAPAGVFQLGPGGTLGARAGDAGTSAVLVPRPGAVPVVCVEADLSQAHYRPSTCRSEVPKWSAAGRWTSPPFSCGGVLIEKGERDVVSRSMADGRTLKHVPIPRTASVTCGDGTVLIGTDQIIALDPNTLRRRWSAAALPHSISAVYLGREDLVYFTPAGPGSSPRPR